MNQILRYEEVTVRLASGTSNNSQFSASDDLLSDLMGVICCILDNVRIDKEAGPDATLDFISFFISVGTIDLIGEKLKRIRSSIDEAPDTCSYLINTASVISVICKLITKF